MKAGIKLQDLIDFAVRAIEGAGYTVHTPPDFDTVLDLLRAAYPIDLIKYIRSCFIKTLAIPNSVKYHPKGTPAYVVDAAMLSYGKEGCGSPLAVAKNIADVMIHNFNL